MTTTTNEAAERLRAEVLPLRRHADLLDLALAAERRATVDRIRAKVQQIDHEAAIGLVFTAAYRILDEEAQRA